MSRRVNGKRGNRVRHRQRKATKVRGGGVYHAAVERGGVKFDALIQRGLQPTPLVDAIRKAERAHRARVRAAQATA